MRCPATGKFQFQFQHITPQRRKRDKSAKINPSIYNDSDARIEAANVATSMEGSQL